MAFSCEYGRNTEIFGAKGAYNHHTGRLSRLIGPQCAFYSVVSNQCRRVPKSLHITPKMNVPCLNRFFSGRPLVGPFAAGNVLDQGVLLFSTIFQVCREGLEA
jgi:hypothetical protein